MHNLKSGANLFNKSTITGEYRRPTQQKSSCHKLPELSKRNTTDTSLNVNEITEIEINSTMQSL